MAKALFHKHQRVFVKPVGTFAMVERVIPHWVKDVPEPLRVTYDVGLGREFTGGELVSEAKLNERQGNLQDSLTGEEWRICLLYTSPSPRDLSTSRMPSSA